MDRRKEVINIRAGINETGSKRQKTNETHSLEKEINTTSKPLVNLISVEREKTAIPNTVSERGNYTRSLRT